MFLFYFYHFKLLTLITFFSLNYLDKHITSAVPSSRSEDWQPWVIYRNSLMHGDAEPGPVTSRRAYTRRNKKETCKFISLFISILIVTQLVRKGLQNLICFSNLIISCINNK